MFYNSKKTQLSHMALTCQVRQKFERNYYFTLLELQQVVYYKFKIAKIETTSTKIPGPKSEFIPNKNIKCSASL